jgi:hypothetical protein
LTCSVPLAACSGLPKSVEILNLLNEFLCREEYSHTYVCMWVFILVVKARKKRLEINN